MNVLNLLTAILISRRHDLASEPRERHFDECHVRVQ